MLHTIWDYFYRFILVEHWYVKVAVFAALSFGLWIACKRSACKRLGDWAQGHAVPILGALFLLALFLRLAWAWWIPHAPFGEELQLLEPAQGIAQGHGYTLKGEPSARRSVAYCVLLSIFFHVPNPLAWIRALNLLLSSCTVFLFYAVGKQICGKGAGLLAALLWTVYPTSIFASNLILDEHLAIPLMLLGVVWAMQYLREPRTRYLLGAGLAWGIGALARPVIAALPPMLLVAYIEGQISLWRALKSSALVMVLVIACALPWVIRNWIVLGIPILYTTQNYGFYWGNNAYYEVDNPRNPLLDESRDAELHRIQALAGDGNAQEARYSNAAVRRALAWIVSDPKAFVTKTIGKALHFLGFSQQEWAINYNFDTLRPGFIPPKAPIVQWLMIKPQNWFYVLMFLSSLVGFCVCVARWLRPNRQASFALVFLCGLGVFALTVLFMPQLKYRYMLDPFLILGCAYYAISLAGSAGLRSGPGRTGLIQNDMASRVLESKGHVQQF